MRLNFIKHIRIQAHGKIFNCTPNNKMDQLTKHQEFATASRSMSCNITSGHKIMSGIAWLVFYVTKSIYLVL